MYFKLYRSPVVGDGSFENPWRSKMCEHITNSEDQKYWDWIHDACPVRYGLVFGDMQLHTLISKDESITELTPCMKGLPGLESYLKTALISHSLLDEMVSTMESDGFPAHWITSRTTLREVLQYLSKAHVTIQEFRCKPDPDGLMIFKYHPDTYIEHVDPVTQGSFHGYLRHKKIAHHYQNEGRVRHLTHVAFKHQDRELMDLGPVQLGS